MTLLLPVFTSAITLIPISSCLISPSTFISRLFGFILISYISPSLSSSMASFEISIILPYRSPYFWKLKVSIFTATSWPSFKKPMSLFRTFAFIIKGASEGTMDIRLSFGLTTPPSVWISSFPTNPSTGDLICWVLF